MYTTFASGKPQTTCGRSQTDVDIRDFQSRFHHLTQQVGVLAHLNINAKKVFLWLWVKEVVLSLSSSKGVGSKSSILLKPTALLINCVELTYFFLTFLKHNCFSPKIIYSQGNFHGPYIQLLYYHRKLDFSFLGCDMCHFLISFYLQLKLFCLLDFFFTVFVKKKTYTLYRSGL